MKPGVKSPSVCHRWRSFPTRDANSSISTKTRIYKIKRHCCALFRATAQTAHNDPQWSYSPSKTNIQPATYKTIGFFWVFVWFYDISFMMFLIRVAFRKPPALQCRARWFWISEFAAAEERSNEARLKQPPKPDQGWLLPQPAERWNGGLNWTSIWDVTFELWNNIG